MIRQTLIKNSFGVSGTLKSSIQGMLGSVKLLKEQLNTLHATSSNGNPQIQQVLNRYLPPIIQAAEQSLNSIMQTASNILAYSNTIKSTCNEILHFINETESIDIAKLIIKADLTDLKSMAEKLKTSTEKTAATLTQDNEQVNGVISQMKAYQNQLNNQDEAMRAQIKKIKDKIHYETHNVWGIISSTLKSLIGQFQAELARDLKQASLLNYEIHLNEATINTLLQMVEKDKDIGKSLTGLHGYWVSVSSSLDTLEQDVSSAQSDSDFNDWKFDIGDIIGDWNEIDGEVKQMLS